MKFAKIIFFLVVISYTCLAHYASPLNKTGTNCTNKLIRSLAPWDSGCFYSAEFNDGATQDQLFEEKSRLNRFIEKKGSSPSIYWYRYTLYRKYFDQLSLSIKDVNQAFHEFISSDPRAIYLVVRHVEYLVENQEFKLAQDTLDSYCNKYLAKNKHAIYTIFNDSEVEANFDLNINSCRDRINVSS